MISLKAAVLYLQLGRLLEEAGEPVPRVVCGERALGQFGEAVETLLEQCLDQLALVGKAPVRGADPDAGVVGDLVKPDGQPLAANSSAAASRMRRRLGAASARSGALEVMPSPCRLQIAAASPSARAKGRESSRHRSAPGDDWSPTERQLSARCREHGEPR